MHECTWRQPWRVAKSWRDDWPQRRHDGARKSVESSELADEPWRKRRRPPARPAELPEVPQLVLLLLLLLRSDSALCAGSESLGPSFYLSAGLGRQSIFRRVCILESLCDDAGARARL